MSSNVKIALVVSLIVVMPALLLARSHQDVWVVEDFESYETSADMLADVVMQWPTTGGPWWNAFSLVDILTFMGSGGQAGGDGTPPFPTSITLGETDPNGFLAFGKDGLEVHEPNQPKCMIIHYETTGDSSVDVLMLARHTGLPLFEPAAPLLPIMVTDLTKFDKVQFKIKLVDGEPSPSSAVTFSVANDKQEILGYYRAERLGLPLGIIGASRVGAVITDEDPWQLIEFDLSAILHAYTSGIPEGSVKTLGSSIAAITVGFEDKGARNVTIALDDIAFYRESECPEYLVADVNGDCQVTLGDLAIIAGQWGQP